MKVNGSFLLLLQGLSITNVGLTLFNTVCILWLVKAVNSGSLVGLFVSVSGVLMAVMTLAGGILADRFSRKTIIVLVDCLSGIMIVSVSLVFYAFDIVLVHIVCLFFVQSVLGILVGISGPAFFALLPSLLSANHLPMGNVVFNVCMLGSGMLGRLVGGLLFGLWSVPALLLMTGLGYFLSAFSERFIQEPDGDTVVAPTHQVKGGWMTAAREMKQGLAYVFSNTAIRLVIIMRLGCLWCMGTLTVTLPFVIAVHYDKGEEWFGYWMAVIALGAGTGAAYAGMRFNRLRGINGRVMLYSYSLLALPLLCIGIVLTTNIYIATVLMFLIGFCSLGMPEFFVMTQLQLTVPNKLRGRVMSVYIMTTSFIAIGAFLGGVFIDLLDKDVVLVQWMVSTVACLMIYPLFFNRAWLEFINYLASENTRENERIV